MFLIFIKLSALIKRKSTDEDDDSFEMNMCAALDFVETKKKIAFEKLENAIQDGAVSDDTLSNIRKQYEGSVEACFETKQAVNKCRQGKTMLSNVAKKYCTEKEGFDFCSSEKIHASKVVFTTGENKNINAPKGKIL